MIAFRVNCRRYRLPMILQSVWHEKVERSRLESAATKQTKTSWETTRSNQSSR